MKILYILIAVFVLIILTLHFWLSPGYLLDKINEGQHQVSVRAAGAEGGFLTEYGFRNVKLERAGRTVLEIDNIKANISLFKLLIGSLKVGIDSEVVKGYLELTLGGNLWGEFNIKNLPFDTELFNIPQEVSFKGFIEGKLKIDEESALFEFKLNNLIWRNFEIENNKLPLDLFDRAKGGIEIVKNEINIKSIGFEGEKGYARLVGSIKSGKSDLFIEIFSKNFTEPYLIPFYEFRQSQGYYKIPVNIKL